MIRRRAAAATVAAAMTSLWMAVSGGPAQALAPSTIAATTPTWGAGILRSGGNSFTTAPGSPRDTYVAAQRLYRVSSLSGLTCTHLGCTGADLVEVAQRVDPFTSIPAGVRVYLPEVRGVCRASSASGYRYYFTWVRVSDSSARLRWSRSAATIGRYC